MFGVVPKLLWEKNNPADANNRIEMCSRSLLVEKGNRLILIDTGMGNKQSEKFLAIMADGETKTWTNHCVKKDFTGTTSLMFFSPTYTLTTVVMP